MRYPIRLTAVLLLLIAPCGCRKASPEAARVVDARVPVTVATVKVQPVQRSVDVVGTLYGDQEVVVSAKVSGRVASTERDLGDEVGPQEVLLRLDPTDFELLVAQREAGLQAALAELGLAELPRGDFDPEKVPAVTRARVDAANAEARFRRGSAMFAETPPLITEQEHADLRTAQELARLAGEVAATAARGSLAQARLRAAELAQGRQALADTVAHAPAGYRFRVARRLVSAGEYVREGAPLFWLVALDPIKFRADVPERHAGLVRIGQKVLVTVAGAAEPVAGEVTRKAPQVDAQKRTFQVEIRIANPEGRLLPGGFARGAIQTQVDEQVIFVPQDAVVVALGQSKVFTVVDGKAVEHKVTTGAHDGVFLEVVKGDLTATDAVVVSGAGRLAGGVPVAVAGGDQK